jgi:hypothetical protein
MIKSERQCLPHVHHPFVVDGASGTLVGIPNAIMRNLLSGTQETKNAFESHKAKVRNGFLPQRAEASIGVLRRLRSGTH